MPDSAEQPDAQGPDISTVLFYHRHQRVLATPLDTRLEIGRQRASEPSPPRRLDRSDSARIILAPLDDVDVSRSHMQLTSGPDKDSFEVTNLSYSQPIRISPDILLLPGEKKVTELPLLAQFSTYAVRVEPAEGEDLELQPLPERTIAPGKLSVESGLNRLNIDTMDEQLLLRWLETVLGVFQSAANSRDFPELAAKALVKIVGLDAAAMLQCDSEGPLAHRGVTLSSRRPERRHLDSQPNIAGSSPQGKTDLSPRPSQCTRYRAEPTKHQCAGVGANSRRRRKCDWRPLRRSP